MSRHVVRSSTWSPWRTVMWFGVVSLAADMVYEGARSITGPYLASLGASALVVGLVTGAGEAAALTFRLFSGPMADRTGRYWSLTIVGYGLTAVSVPLMALAPFVGGAGLVLAASLVLIERTGKAIRSPSKSALLAHAARAVGRGRGFGVHKAMDQVGSISGPLVVAGLIAVFARPWIGLAALAIPGFVAMVILLWIRREVPDLSVYDEPAEPGRQPDVSGGTATVAAPVTEATRVATSVPAPRLPREFQFFAASCAANTLGLMTFGVISFHLVQAKLFDLPVVPVVYAGAMAAAAVTALLSGFAFDRVGPHVLLSLPVLVAVVPMLAFASTRGWALVGVLLWGGVTGIQDSTVKALVADLVPSARLATAYGYFAALQGVAALMGGGLAGWLYTDGVGDLVAVVAVFQAISLVLLWRVLRRTA